MPKIKDNGYLYPIDDEFEYAILHKRGFRNFSTISFNKFKICLKEYIEELNLQKEHEDTIIFNCYDSSMYRDMINYLSKEKIFYRCPNSKLLPESSFFNLLEVYEIDYIMLKLKFSK